MCIRDSSLSARISIYACSRSVDRDAEWAWNSVRAWPTRSPTADAALSDSARWSVSTPTTRPVSVESWSLC
eukprot:11734103-Alexandrium_andersonii.AAC.1